MFNTIKNNRGYAGLIMLLVTMALILFFFYISRDYFSEREIIKEQANQTINVQLETMGDNVGQSNNTLEEMLEE